MAQHTMALPGSKFAFYHFAYAARLQSKGISAEVQGFFSARTLRNQKLIAKCTQRVGRIQMPRALPEPSFMPVFYIASHTRQKYTDFDPAVETLPDPE